jgi:glucokinase
MSDVFAGYVSGSRVDLVRVAQGDGPIELIDQRSYSAKDYPNLDSILRLYLKKTRMLNPVACLGVAGPVIAGEVSTTNLPWHIVASDIEDKFSFKRVKLINDTVATAHALPHLGPDKLFSLNNGTAVRQAGSIGLIAAGSGLGEAIIYSDGSQYYPHASEGGHADFAPFNQLESELWGYVYSELGRVEAEDIVSRAGMERIYHFLVDTQGGTHSQWFAKADDKPAAIIEEALADRDDTASRTLGLFIDCYASEAANLALKGMTIGGIYVGGLIAPQIITLLDSKRFMDRFTKRGKMEALLRSIPVGVIIEEQAPLLGAAGVALSLG